MSYDYDAIIIGAGTSGLAAGSALQKAGKSYVILDKKKEIGLPVRSTGAVSLEWVNRIGMPTDRSIIASEIHAMSFRTDTGKSISMSFNRAVGLVYNFTEYERYLAEKFAGRLNIKMETRVNSVKDETVFTDSEKITAKYIIMAAGPQSNMGIKLPRDRVLVAYEEIRRLPKRDDYEMILWFSDSAPGGYFWDFADGPDRRKIGVCYYPFNGRVPKDVLAEFTEKFPELKGDMLETMAHQIPLTEPAEKVIDGNIMYVGDMVNAVLNTTAGGLQGAFWSGTTAGIAAAANNPLLYQQKWDGEIRPWLMKHHLLHQKLHKKGAKSIGKYMTLAKLMPTSFKKRVFGGL